MLGQQNGKPFTKESLFGQVIQEALSKRIKNSSEIEGPVWEGPGLEAIPPGLLASLALMGHQNGHSSKNKTPFGQIIEEALNQNTTNSSDIGDPRLLKKFEAKLTFESSFPDFLKGIFSVFGSNQTSISANENISNSSDVEEEPGLETIPPGLFVSLSLMGQQIGSPFKNESLFGQAIQESLNQSIQNSPDMELEPGLETLPPGLFSLLASLGENSKGEESKPIVSKLSSSHHSGDNSSDEDRFGKSPLEEAFEKFMMCVDKYLPDDDKE